MEDTNRWVEGRSFDSRFSDRRDKLWQNFYPTILQPNLVPNATLRCYIFFIATNYQITSTTIGLETK